MSSQTYTDEDILNSLQRLADELDHSPTAREIRKSDITPSKATMQRRFDGVNAAKQEAGLETNKTLGASNEVYSDKELLNLLEDVAEELGRSPTAEDLSRHPDAPRSGTYSRRFGSFNEAKEEAGLETTPSADEVTWSQSKLREWFRSAKQGLSCAECSEDHPATLQFDHVNPEEKEHSISDMIQDGHYDIEEVIEEMNKCRVLCANCHMIKTHGDSYDE